MKKLTGVALQEMISSSRASFAESDWGPNANTEAKRLASIVRVLEVNLRANGVEFDTAEAAAIVDKILARQLPMIGFTSMNRYDMGEALEKLLQLQRSGASRDAVVATLVLLRREDLEALVFAAVEDIVELEGDLVRIESPSENR